MKTFRPTIALIATLYANVAHAYDFKVDGMCFSFIPDQFHSVALAEFETTDDDPDNEGYTGDFVIPSTVTYYGIKYTVKGIEGSPFKNVTSLFIPSTIENLTGQIFDGAVSLNSIEIEGDSYIVENKAIYTSFYKKLIYSFDFVCSEYSIKEGVEQVSDYAFCNSSNIKKLTYCEGIRDFGDVDPFGTPYGNPFIGLTGVEELVVPSTIKMYHGSVPSVTYNLNSNALEHLFSLKSIVVSPQNKELCSIDGVLYDKDVSLLLFYPSKKSGDYIVPSTVTGRIHIAPYNSYFEGVNLPSITLNNNISELYLQSSSLETINLHEGITELTLICPNLVNLDIPTTVTNFNIRDCSRLLSLDMSHITITAVKNSMFSGCNKLEELLLPSSITEVESFGFYGLPRLKNICLPAGVTKVGSNIFEDCQSLESIICLSKVPPTFHVYREGEDAYQYLSHGTEDFYDKVILYVPKGCANEYRSSQLWGQIKTIQEIETEDVLANSISISQSDLILKAGDSYTLNATILPSYATSKAIIWSSSNENIASVEDGVVTAIAVGEATITATTTDGSNLSASCKVTVVANQDEAIAELQTLVDQAQALYDNSTEGENIGQYAPGSRAALLAVIKAVKAKISSTMSESDITECTTQITNAINAFKAQQVSAGADTDITLYDDIIYVNPVECGPGQQVTLSLQMNNLKSFVGYQCDLTLPNGMTFAKDEDNFYMAEMSLERTTTKKTDYFNVELQSDGALRFLCSSSKKYTFDGNEGEVATVTINIPADIEDGDYPLILTNVVMTDDAGKTTEVSYVKTTLTVTAFTLGDANGDGSVNVGDFAATAAYILGPDVPEGFVEKAADANCDTKINVGDLAAIAAIILGPGANAAPQRADEAEATAEMTMELTASETTGEYLLYVGINNVALPFSGYQFDLVLPQGLTVKTDEDGFYEASLCEDRTNARRTDYFNSALQSDGALRVLCASTQNAMFEGETGHVAAIKLAAKDSQTQGAIELKSAMLTNGGDVTSLDDTLIMFDHSVTNIEQLRNEQSIRVYDLNGQLIRYGKNSEECLKDMPHGVYVVNGVKVVL